MRYFQNIVLAFCFILRVSAATQADDPDEVVYKKGLAGLHLYEEGNYVQASPLLKEAVDCRKYMFALAYADICRRDLDEAGHHLREAAHYYLVAAEEGYDADAAAYLDSLDPIFAQKDIPYLDKIRLLKDIWLKEGCVFNGNKGFDLFMEGKIKEAARFLKRSAQGGHPVAQGLYADICQRQLDDKPHLLQEAATWRLLAAQGREPESSSYLSSLIPHSLLTRRNAAAQINGIVEVWVREKTETQLKRLKPSQVNDYLIHRYNRKIDLTTSQKIPYFFDKLVTSLMCQLGSMVVSVVEEECMMETGETEPQEAKAAVPVPPQTCREEALPFEAPHYDQLVRPYEFGPVYPTYLEKLQDLVKKQGLKNGDSLPPLETEDAPYSIDILYQYLLDALNRVLPEERSATQLSCLTHQENPWLIAGIKFWKLQNPGTLFNRTSLPEDSLMETLTQMTTSLSESDLEAILKEIETKSNWPNDREHPISREFSENVRRFFRSPLSLMCPLVQEARKAFEVRVQSLTVDCENDDRILKSPFLMTYTKDLTLENARLDLKGWYKTFSEAQRYFTDIKTITIVESEKSKAPLPEALHLLHKLEKIGIKVNREKKLK
jgi:hypothetical protein